MKNTKFLGIAAIVAVIVFTMAACAGLTLDYVETDSVTGPAQVRQGRDLNPRDITVYGIYKDGSRKTITVNARDITFDRNTAGPQTVRINIKGNEVSFQTQVMPVRSLSITSQPTTAVFKLGQVASPNWQGLALRAEWDGMGSDTVAIGDCTITGYNKDRAGRQAITVSYGGRTATFNIEVIELVSIRITTPPTKTTYIVGERLDITGLAVTGTWSNNTTEAATVSASNVTGFDSSTLGTKTLTVTFGGKTTTFNVSVLAVTSIAVTRQPTKTVYGKGETLDLTGLVVTATYSNNTTAAATIAASNVTGFNSSTIGTKTLTVTYGGKTTTFDITVVEITTLVITRQPTKTVYNIGEALNVAGLVVTANYSDGTSAQIQTPPVRSTVIGDSVTPFNSNTPGERRITVSYGGKQAYFNVTVNTPAGWTDPVPGEVPSALVGTWWDTSPNIFKVTDENGNEIPSIVLNADGTMRDSLGRGDNFEVSGNLIRRKPYSWVVFEWGRFSVSGNRLTITNAYNSGFSEGTYTKR